MPTVTSFSTHDLIPVLMRLARDQFEGCVQVRSNTRGVCDVWRFREGRIVDLSTSDEIPFLEQVLLLSDRLRDKDRKRLRKQAHSEGRNGGQVLLEQGLLSDGELTQLLLSGIQRRIAVTLEFSSGSVDLEPGPWAPEEAGLAYSLQLSLSIEEMLLGAAQLLGRWDLVRGVLPSLKDVYYATADSFSFMQAPDEFPAEVAFLSSLDGERDLMEVLDLAEIDPFLNHQLCQNLHVQGMVALINPVQLFQLGCEFERQEDHARAVRRFERAEERGLDDFDLGFKLAEGYQRLGQDAQAIEHYLLFAEKCVGQFRIEDTIRCCGRILELDPDNAAIQDRYLTLLSRYGDEEETVAQALALAQRFVELGKEDRARITAERMLEVADSNEELLRFYLDLCTRTGHEDGANHARRQLGNLFHEREESEKALELYQNLFVQGEDTVEVRSRLAELHFLAGNPDKAGEHLMALRGRRGWEPHDADATALEFHRRLLREGIEVEAITGWLVEEARQRGDRDDTARVLRIHRDALERAEQLGDARRAAENLVSLCPNDLDAARVLARLESVAGDPARAALMLENLATMLQQSGDDDEALHAVLEELIRVNPLSLVGRRLWLSSDSVEASKEQREQLTFETALLELLAGETPSALDRFETLPYGDGSRAYFSYLSGTLCATRGDQASALECFHRAATLAADGHDKILLGACLEVLQKLTPSDPQIARFQQQHDELLEVAPSTSRPQELVHAPIAGITDRLRNLKSGGRTERTAPETRETRSHPKPKQAPLSAVAKLRALQGGPSAVQQADGTVDAAATPQGEVFTSSSGPAAGSSPTENALDAIDALVERAPPKVGGIASSMAKLRSLKGDAADTAPSEPAPPKAPEVAASTQDSDEDSDGKIDHPQPKPSKNLGGAASKLGALRSKQD